MNAKSLEKLELNKILATCAEYCTLDRSKSAMLALAPSPDIEEVRARLSACAEGDKLLYRYGVGKVEHFPEVGDLVVRASKGSTLSMGELLDVNCLLRSARTAYEGISAIEDEDIKYLKSVAHNLYFDARLEEEIASAILSPEEMSDYASDALFSIRSKIKSLNERIRSTLSEYASGKDSQYLQDGIVTIRNDRYVVPVKAEYKSRVKGFVHDRSQSGATFFIEPEYVLNLNNELIALRIDEKEEIERILKGFSSRIGAMSDRLQQDEAHLSEIDCCYARAEYSYSKKAVCPKVNGRGYIDIIKGRHPLIDKDKVVPVSVELGKDYNFLLLSGANTGGKTVTLKMVGLFCLMAQCGIFIPASEGSTVCAFREVFCDVGDSQSIEESLSTFSSHITNVISICDNADDRSLVLIDELGGGTNPDEGQALARAICEHLLAVGSKGIITTHFTALKEFAYAEKGIENAAMEFDRATLKPLYSIKIGAPGASNALAISRRLGMDGAILEKAESYLSEGGRNYENIIRKAEENRVESQKILEENEATKRELDKKLAEANALVDKLNKEREKLGISARAESRRIINERTQRAEELLSELEGIFRQSEIKESDLIKARTLKNRIGDEAYDDEQGVTSIVNFTDATADNLKVGQRVYVKSADSQGDVISVNARKGEAEIAMGSIRMRTAITNLQIVPRSPKKRTEPPKEKVKVVRKFTPSQPQMELNVIGMNVDEALVEVENFLDKAVMDNLEEVKIIHGAGTGRLRNAIAERLKKHRHVKEFRSGRYGEGEIGVTIVTLK